MVDSLIHASRRSGFGPRAKIEVEDRQRERREGRENRVYGDANDHGGHARGAAQRDRTSTESRRKNNVAVTTSSPKTCQ